ncbi:aminoacyl-tRNA hydrolase [Candidatus Saccharibacteria bacterium]|nr:aminoacyl-tRNA hydrolase [Candidatus Saccharibacteria bacterium]
MKLLFFLGNPGAEYNFTRHNLGFLLADFYLKTLNKTWEPHEKFHSVYKKLDSTLLVKPTTFYNNVGLSLGEWKNFYKLDLTDLLVICDDFHLPFGTSRFREKGTAGGNNGLKSVIETLGTDAFPRLRLGTGNDELRKTLGDIDFVLSRFTEEEKKQLPDFLLSVLNVL